MADIDSIVIKDYNTAYNSLTMEHPIDHLIDLVFNNSEEMTEMDNEKAKPTTDDIVTNIDDLRKDMPIPILPLRDNVCFPDTLLPVTAGRTSSKRLLKAADRKDWLIGVVPQIHDVENPSLEDLSPVGCIAHIVHLIPNDDNKTILAVLEGICPFKVGTLIQDTPYMVATVNEILSEDETGFKSAESRSTLAELRSKATIVNRSHNGQAQPSLKGLKGKTLLNFLCCHTSAPVKLKLAWLKTIKLTDRLQKISEFYDNKMQEVKLAEEIEQKTRKEMDRQQREFLLNQQLNVIQRELGGNPAQQDYEELKQQAEKKHWNTDTENYFFKELNKLTRLNPQQPDYTVQLNYLKLFLDLPWSITTTDNLDIDHARKVLDNDHYGLEKVKERIIEYLAVLNLKKDFKSPILCLVGPPGTGKTSLGKSIAKALGRKYVRIALGGVNDESEIRGHRRTYVGSMPGRIIQSVKRAGTINPVFVLDEIDKVQTRGHNGDPTSALLEVLDPEQNMAFHDNYLDYDFDLSHVMFIATANDLSSIQRPLLDRMEIIDLSGYVMEEKLEIAKQYIVPRQLKELGLPSRKFTFSQQVLTDIINEHTREAGVRGLEHAIAKVLRHKAVQMVSGQKVTAAVKQNELRDILGLPIHHDNVTNLPPRLGVVNGLAWTSVGGEVLFVEAATTKGKGTLTMTGNLGDVMKESATLAYEYIKSHREELQIEDEKFEKLDIHIHVPAGATPKDGPSAGITMFTAMMSVLSNRAVRSDVAMTGEVTLRGLVTAVGGIREKILAAKAAGVKHLILSKENQRDIEDIPANYIEGLSFTYINEMKEVIPLVLV